MVRSEITDVRDSNNINAAAIEVSDFSYNGEHNVHWVGLTDYHLPPPPDLTPGYSQTQQLLVQEKNDKTQDSASFVLNHFSQNHPIEFQSNLDALISERSAKGYDPKTQTLI